MGYKVNSNLYKLKFEGTDYDGLEIVVRGLSVGSLLELESMSKGDSGKSLKGVRRMAEILTARIKEWNLEDDNGYVPISLEAVLDLEIDLLTAIVSAWSESQASVDENLGKGSDSGRTSPEVSIPMETL